MIKKLLLPMCLAMSCSASDFANNTLSESDSKEANRLVTQLERHVSENLDLVTKLHELYARDQFVRRSFTKMLKDPSMKPEVKTRFQSKGGKLIHSADIENTAQLKQLLRKYTWRHIANTSRSAASGAFLVVQHSGDLEFQKQALTKVKPLVLENLMEPSTFALLADRIATNENRPQLFGSQAVCEGGAWVPKTLHEPENVDERRNELGLGKLEDYYTKLKEMYGPCSMMPSGK